MQASFSKKIMSQAGLVISAVVLAIAFFGPAQAHHGEFMEAHNPASFCRAQGCGEPMGDLFCFSQCLSVFASNLQTLPAKTPVFLPYVLVFCLLISINYLAAGGRPFYFKSFIRKKREVFARSFFVQIGRWLILFGKRDPAEVFALIQLRNI